MPRVKLLTEVAKNLGRDIEILHLGTCVKVAMETADCPLDYGEVKILLEIRPCGGVTDLFSFNPASR